MDFDSSFLSDKRELKEPNLMQRLLALRSLDLVGDVLGVLWMGFLRGE